ncbi:N-acetylmuramoyl-L-alanine amidase family protein [Alkalihalophilus marmarensis]|uniref:N-acetylmuramoyl-L-alanine amidase family protein n=1 Tax=Alkalihalophilus marmarensis TaxID=521377 RepID=UPI002DB96756|nr:N-acetylmuramoyl-L-alanine amidase [Alkalihalophilus marmarensis]MEC2074439.1 N-acetylmuramoyl-L-alanine amidase [Alkalihalophilus marmarensis]
MVKIFIDPGHGGHDSGAAAGGLLEKNIVLDISLQIQELLLVEYSNVQVQLSRTTDTFVSLGERVRRANLWGAHYFCSVHVNAGNGIGYEDFVYNKLSNTSKTVKHQGVINREIVKTTGLYNRGSKKANFEVLRGTKMSAILTENGFIDNEINAHQLRDSAFINRIAIGHVSGFAQIFNLHKNN